MISLKNTFSDIFDDLGGKERLFFKKLVSNYLFSARFRVLLNFRLGKYFFYNFGFLGTQISRYYRYRLNTIRCCDISFRATICKDLRLPHPIGIVIGEGVVINNNVKIFQHVTLGSHGRKGEEMNYPIVKDNVIIFAGATIIGGVTIGENSVIGANSVVNKDVPPNSIAYGIPCIIKMKE